MTFQAANARNRISALLGSAQYDKASTVYRFVMLLFAVTWNGVCDGIRLGASTEQSQSVERGSR